MEANVKKLFSVKPISGWAMRRLLQLDEVVPGVLREITMASELRRQAEFHFLAVTSTETETARADELAARMGPDAKILKPLQVVAKALIELRAEDIFEALYNDAKGLVGLHKRLGRDPLCISHYRALGRILELPGDGKRAKVLMQLKRPAGDLIELTETVPEALLHPSIIENLGTTSRLDGVLDTIAAIKAMNPDVKDTDIAASLRRLESHKALRGWARRWLSKGRHSHAPDLGTERRFRLLGSGEDLVEAGRRFQNCLREQTTEAALGRAAYLEFLPTPAIVHLVALSEGRWLVEAIHGAKNEKIDIGVIGEIVSSLARLGILLPRGIVDGGSYNNAYNLAGEHFRGLRFGNLVVDVGNTDFDDDPMSGWTEVA